MKGTGMLVFLLWFQGVQNRIPNFLAFETSFRFAREGIENTCILRGGLGGLDRSSMKKMALLWATKA